MAKTPRTPLSEPSRGRRKRVEPPAAPTTPATVQPVRGAEQGPPYTPTERVADQKLPKLPSLTPFPISPPVGPAGASPANPLTHHVVLDLGGHVAIEPAHGPNWMDEIAELDCVYCNHTGSAHIYQYSHCAQPDCNCMRFIDPRYFKPQGKHPISSDPRITTDDILLAAANRLPRSRQEMIDRQRETEGREEIIDLDEGTRANLEKVINDFIHGKASANKVREAMGLQPYSDPEVNTRARILATASDIINGDRARVYGPPSVSFNRIADIWNAMGIRIGEKTEDIGQLRELRGSDVALVLLGMKLSRTIGAHDHEDNWIDLAGYAGLGAELSEGEKDGYGKS